MILNHAGSTRIMSAPKVLVFTNPVSYQAMDFCDWEKLDSSVCILSIFGGFHVSIYYSLVMSSMYTYIYIITVHLYIQSSVYIHIYFYIHILSKIVVWIFMHLQNCVERASNYDSKGDFTLSKGTCLKPLPRTWRFLPWVLNWIGLSFQIYVLQANVVALSQPMRKDDKRHDMPDLECFLQIFDSCWSFPRYFKPNIWRMDLHHCAVHWFYQLAGLGCPFNTCSMSQNLPFLPPQNCTLILSGAGSCCAYQKRFRKKTPEARCQRFVSSASSIGMSAVENYKGSVDIHGYRPNPPVQSRSLAVAILQRCQCSMFGLQILGAKTYPRRKWFKWFLGKDRDREGTKYW